MILSLMAGGFLIFFAAVSMGLGGTRAFVFGTSLRRV